MITPEYFAGGWYADALPNGPRVVLFPGSHLQTVAGSVNLPNGQDVLFAVVGDYGRICLAGQGHDDGQTWLWNGLTWQAVCPSYGTSPCAFGPAGLYASIPGAQGNIQIFDPLTFGKGFPLTQPLGVRGIALVSADGAVHGQDAWYGQYGLAEYVDLGGVRVGQGPNGGLLVSADAVEGVRQLVAGSAEFIRAHRVGNVIAGGAWQRDTGRAVTFRFAVDEIASLPLAVVPAVPPVVVPPIVVVPPTKEPVPMSIPNQLETVVRVRGQYPTPLGVRHPAFLIEVAKATGAKLLRKDGGTHVTLPNGVNVSQDILMFADQGVDVLGDGEGAATPGWSEKGTIAGEYVDVSGMGAPVVTGPPVVTPSDTSYFQAKIALLEAATAALRDSLAAEAAARAVLAATLADLAGRVDQIDGTAVRLGHPITLTGGTGRTYGHAHGVTLTGTL